ncbi:MAG: hypothetical protein GQ570_13330 [Helicobacteraceae bacterium]|nr:hypothetical protein [Helicobacteraceae bacterium]
MKKTKAEIIKYINELKGYQGYVQFSDRPIENIFREFNNISIDAKKGFVYEAHFYNGVDSITIKQVNESWLVDIEENTAIDNTQYLWA